MAVKQIKTVDLPKSELRMIEVNISHHSGTILEKDTIKPWDTELGFADYWYSRPRSTFSRTCTTTT